MGALQGIGLHLLYSVDSLPLGWCYPEMGKWKPEVPPGVFTRANLSDHLFYTLWPSPASMSRRRNSPALVEGTAAEPQVKEVLHQVTAPGSLPS